MSTSERIVFLDGQHIPAREASISPVDAGVIFGLGSFETVRVYRGRPFLPDRHEARLRGTLERLGIEPPAFDLASIFTDLSRVNGLPEARGRALVTAGPERSDGGFGPSRLYAEVRELPPDPLEGRDGVSVHVASGVLGGLMPLPGIKSLSYLPNTLARREARALGAEEAILRSPRGEILEGATSNVHVVIGGVLVTPPADGRVLEGVTRGVVLELARRTPVPVEERVLLDRDLARAEEAFLTSTIREVLPIERFGELSLRAPGPITAGLRAAYRAYVDEVIGG